MIWWIAASLPSLVGRNPFLLIITLLCVMIVRFVTITFAATAFPSKGVIRLAVIFVGLGVVFNALSVRAGDIIVFVFPATLPVLSGPVTLNAVVYGVLSGAAILILVVAGVTTASVLDWSALMRSLPGSLTGVGVAGSIAFTFFPQMIASFRDLREARVVRGAPLDGPRDYLALIPPLLNAGLERAVSLAELLETRGFGSTLAVSSERNLRQGIAVAIGLTAACCAVYAFALGEILAAFLLLSLTIGSAVGASGMRSLHMRQRTRYRESRRTLGDAVVIGGALMAILTIAAALFTHPSAVRYEPYPSLSPPGVSLWLLLGVCGLLGPAIVVSVRGAR